MAVRTIDICDRCGSEHERRHAQPDGTSTIHIHGAAQAYRHTAELCHPCCQGAVEVLSAYLCESPPK